MGQTWGKSWDDGTVRRFRSSKQFLGLVFIVSSMVVYWDTRGMARSKDPLKLKRFRNPLICATHHNAPQGPFNLHKLRGQRRQRGREVNINEVSDEVNNKDLRYQ